jgi:mitochondrial import receptor subunit TOM70
MSVKLRRSTCEELSSTLFISSVLLLKMCSVNVRFLMGDVEGSKEDFLLSIKLVPSFTQSLVKIASVYMEQSDQEKTFECFDNAIKQNPKDPDIYYHRGQGFYNFPFSCVTHSHSLVVLFIMNDFTKAAENYTMSTELDDQFVFSHIQLAVAQYKSGELVTSMATFRRTIKAFPQRSEPQNY